MTEKTLIAVDLGAQSCRVSLLNWNQGTPRIRLIHRFPNGPIVEGGRVRWDVGRIYNDVEKGLRLCAEVAGEKIAAIGVDGWAVDYVRLKPNGEAPDKPFCYRDERTVESEKQVHRLISRKRLYELTGIQFLRANTLYQLYADPGEGVDQHLPWLNIPEYITQRLGGEGVSEYTNATHCELVSLDTRDWCSEIFSKTGLDLKAAPKIVPTGSIVGQLKPARAEYPALKETQIVVPACHDTASAVAGIPAHGDDWGFISSGTWSLVGTILDSPCTSAEALDKNFSNLGGAGGKVCFLRNVNGMWLLNQCLEQWKLEKHEVPLDELIVTCSVLPAPANLLNVDEPEFFLPGDMPAIIRKHLMRTGHASLPSGSEGIAPTANLILHSLAARYAEVLQELAVITKKKIRHLYIVGGGSRNEFLNRLTAEKTGLTIVKGSPESSTIGNFAIQLATLCGDYSLSAGVSHSAVTKWATQLMTHSHELSAF